MKMAGQNKQEKTSKFKIYFELIWDDLSKSGKKTLKKLGQLLLIWLFLLEGTIERYVEKLHSRAELKAHQRGLLLKFNNNVLGVPIGKFWEYTISGIFIIVLILLMSSSIQLPGCPMTVNNNYDFSDEEGCLDYEELNSDLANVDAIDHFCSDMGYSMGFARVEMNSKNPIKIHCFTSRDGGTDEHDYKYPDYKAWLIKQQ